MVTTRGIVEVLKTEHQRLSKQVEAIGAALSAFGAAYSDPKVQKSATKRKTMSAAARKKIGAGQKLRWAKIKAQKAKKSKKS
jgi:hypothetical protein